MAPGDLPYAKFDTRPLFVAVRTSVGWWDWIAKSSAPPVKQLEPKRFAIPMYKDTIFPDLQAVIIPAAARVDGCSLLVVGTMEGGVFTPCKDEGPFWISLSSL